MASLTLKNIPDDLLDKLRDEARKQHRSLNKQALLMLSTSLEAGSDTPNTEALEQVARWRELAGTWVSDQTPEQETADIYDARTAGRSVDL